PTQKRHSHAAHDRHPRSPIRGRLPRPTARSSLDAPPSRVRHPDLVVLALLGGPPSVPPATAAACSSSASPPASSSSHHRSPPCSARSTHAGGSTSTSPSCAST